MDVRRQSRSTYNTSRLAPRRTAKRGSTICTNVAGVIITIIINCVAEVMELAWRAMTDRRHRSEANHSLELWTKPLARHGPWPVKLQVLQCTCSQRKSADFMQRPQGHARLSDNGNAARHECTHSVTGAHWAVVHSDEAAKAHPEEPLSDSSSGSLNTSNPCWRSPTLCFPAAASFAV